MNREATDRFCERGILALVLAILVWGPLASGAVRTQEFVVTMALTAGVVLLWGVRLWTQENPKLLFPPICWGVLAFTGYAIWRYFVCDIEYVGRLELLRILVYAFLFFAIINNLHRQETMQVICYTLIFLAMALSFIAVVQWLTKWNKVPSLSAFFESVLLPRKTWFFARFYTDRASATYINPNHFAGFLEMLLPVALAYTLVGRGKALTKVFLGYAALVIIAGLGMTVSRGGWVACGFTMVVFFCVLTTFRTYQLPALAMLLVVAGGSTFFITRTDYFKMRFRYAFNESGNVEWDTRQLLWRSTLEMWRDHRWTGVGPGHFNYRFNQYRPMRVQMQPDRAHNEYLNLVADWGAVGALCIGATLGLFFLGVAKSWRFVRREEREFKSNYSNKFALVLGGTLGVVSILGHSFTDFNLQIPANAILAVTLAALVSSHLRFATEKYWIGIGRMVKPVLTIVFLAGVTFFLYQTLRLGREYVWLERAAIQRTFSDEQIAALTNAWRVEPKNFETAYRIGEAYRIPSILEGGEDYGELATNAMTWFKRGMRANPFDHRNVLGYAICLDWVKRFDESQEYYWRADALDPNGYFTSSWIAWHYAQVEDFAAAHEWAHRAMKLFKDTNELSIAKSYWNISNRELLRGAFETNRLRW